LSRVERVFDDGASIDRLRGISSLVVGTGGADLIIWGANSYENGPMHERILLEAQRADLIDKSAKVKGGLVIDAQGGEIKRISKDSGTFPGDVGREKVARLLENLECYGFKIGSGLRDLYFSSDE